MVVKSFLFFYVVVCVAVFLRRRNNNDKYITYFHMNSVDQLIQHKLDFNFD